MSNLVRWELALGVCKGILLGFREYDFYDNDNGVHEKDVVIYIGMLQIIITLIYAGERDN